MNTTTAQETSAQRGASLVGSSAWLGGRSVAECRDFIAKNKLKIRAGSIGILDREKMRFEMRPIIECKSHLSRKYLPLEYSDTPWFKDREERDAVLHALTA